MSGPPSFLMRLSVPGLFCLLIVANLAHGMTSRAVTAPLSHRLVYVHLNLSADGQVDEFRSIVERASGHGYNGVAFSGSFDRIDLRDPAYFERLKKVKTICDDHGMELIPIVFSAGYASATLAHDRNLAAGLPVRNVPFVVEGPTARLERDPGPRLSNGSFDRHDKNKASGFTLQDQPGTVTAVDTKIFRDGSSSLRFENFSRSKGGKGRLMQKVEVTPFRCYRLSFWLKTERLDPPNGFQVQVMAPGERVIMMWSPRLEATQDWTQVTLAFNSMSADRVTIWLGIWRGRGGTFWVDDIRLDAAGIINVLRRPGTPVVVRNRDTGNVYDEGVDFKLAKEKSLSYKLDHAEPALEIIAGGRIREGDRLAVDYYQGLAMKHESGQTAVCMSEQKTYEIWRDIARAVQDHLDPDYYFLSMDEIRQGGWCAACEARGLAASELLGDCITRQVEIIRGMNPDAEIFVWSDMLDPNHNAKADFFLFKGDLRGSWEFIPKDLIIACWKDNICEKSLRHFDKLEFRTIGCGYYDTRNLNNAERWMKALGATRGGCGIMYTTWRRDYDFMESFGDVARGLAPTR